ncbi:hypothetical protein PLICRDRAFT_270073 [Plicaturopsis crispa FD-325 SS-3]|nr:hypothetical protein PLICRDRAFT_270073 [Plicaturopsis crispa FD-325 SS-3]
MTSFMINAHVKRKTPAAWKQDPSCPFCRIVSGELSAFRVFENDMVVAILDILPLRRGHTLVIPKAHHSRLSELPPEYGAATGEAVSKVAHALTLDNTALNVVCNQEYAQAVPHVHYHVIPAPILGATTPTTAVDPATPLTAREMHQKEFEGREELDDQEGEALAQKIRARL